MVSNAKATLHLVLVGVDILLKWSPSFSPMRVHRLDRGLVFVRNIVWF